MKTHILLPAILVLAVSLSSCSQRFNPLLPEHLGYDAGENAGDSVFVSYRMDLQDIAENRMLTSLEKTNHMMVIGIKIYNASSDTVRLTPLNFGIYGDQGQEKTIYPPKKYCRTVRQPALLYFFNPVGYGLIGIMDGILAVEANQRHLAYERQKKIWNRIILPHEFAYGLVALNTKDSENLGFYYSKKIKPVGSIIDIRGRYREPDDSPLTGKFQYRIFLNDGRQIVTTASIQSEECRQFIMADVQGTYRKIVPAETKMILRMKDNTRVCGVPDEGLWIFKVITGSINAYNFSGETKSIDYIQKANGPILPFSPEGLAAMTDQWARADEMIEKQHYWKAVVEYNEAF